MRDQRHADAEAQHRGRRDMPALVDDERGGALRRVVEHRSSPLSGC